MPLLLKLARLSLELAYDLAREALRPKPEPSAGPPLPWRALEHQRAQAAAAARPASAFQNGEQKR